MHGCPRPALLILLLLAALSHSLTGYAQDEQYLLWAKTSGLTGGSTVQQSDLDENRNLYVIGTTYVVHPWYADSTQVIGIEQILIRKYDTNGNELWSKIIGSNRDTGRAGDIRVDRDGDVIFTGYMNDPDGLSFGQPITGYFMCKMDQSGVVKWITMLSRIHVWTWGSTIQSFGQQSKMEIDSDNSIVLYTNYNPVSIRQSMHGMYLQRYSEHGVLLMQTQVTRNDNFDEPTPGGLAIAPDGSLIIAGLYHVSLQIGPLTFGTPGDQSNAPVHMFIARYSASGDFIWAKSNPWNYSAGHDVQTDDDGNIYFTGYADGHFAIDGVQLNPGDAPAGFLSKLNLNGEILWTRPTRSNPTSIARIANGDLYLTGSMVGELVYDDYHYPGGDDERVFVIHVDKDGNPKGIFVGGTGEISYSYRVAYNSSIDQEGSIYTIGNFYERIIFGCDTLLDNTSEMFVIKHSSLPPVYSLRINGPSAVCDGALVSLSATAIPEPVDYQWTIPVGVAVEHKTGRELQVHANASADQRHVNLSVRKGCYYYGSSNQYQFNVIYKPATPLINGNAWYCNPGPTRFNATSSTNATSYQWTLPPGINAAFNQPETSVPEIIGVIQESFAHGSISVASKNECFESASPPFPIELLKAPEPITFTNTESELCSSLDSFEFAVTPSGGAEEYIWTIPQNFAETGTVRTTVSRINLTFASAGNAIITAQARNRCHQTPNTSHNVFLDVPITAPGIFASTCDREVYTDADDLNLQWFRNGELAGQNVSSLLVTEKGEYYAESSNVCGTVRSETLELNPVIEGQIFFPNVITPGDERANNVYTTNPRIDGLSLTLFNRWGETVYTTGNYQHDWNADGLSAGIYYLQVSHPCLTQKYQGVLHVIK